MRKIISMPSINDLPHDVLGCIGFGLGVGDLLRLSHTNRILREAVHMLSVTEIHDHYFGSDSNAEPTEEEKTKEKQAIPYIFRVLKESLSSLQTALTKSVDDDALEEILTMVVQCGVQDMGVGARWKISKIICDLSLDRDKKGVVLGSGSFPVLVDLLSDSEHDVRWSAFNAILRLCDDYRGNVIENKKIVDWIDLFKKSDDEDLRQWVVLTLIILYQELGCDDAEVVETFLKKNLYTIADVSKNADYRAIIVDSQAVSVLVDLLNDSENPGLHDAAVAIWQFCQDPDTSGAIVDAEAVPVLVDLLDHSHEYVREYAALAISSLSLNSDTRKAVVEANPVPGLVRLLGDSDEGVRRAAGEILENLSGDPATRAAVEEAMGGQSE